MRKRSHVLGVLSAAAILTAGWQAGTPDTATTLSAPAAPAATDQGTPSSGTPSATPTAAAAPSASAAPVAAKPGASPSAAQPAPNASAPAPVAHAPGTSAPAVPPKQVKAPTATPVKRVPTASAPAPGPKPVTKPAPKPVPKPAPKPVPKPAPKPVPIPVPPPLPSGTFTGQSVQTRFGAVQVQVTVSAGRITDVRALHLTDSSQRSVQISNRAAPILRSEVLAAQSANIANVSGATYTSNGYIGSLQSALDQAGL